MDGVRERIIVAGERLIAQHGLEVPLRDIALEAGQKNNSAVHYYFGSRDGLIEAILDYRVSALEERRLELLGDLESAGGGGMADWIAILVRPSYDVPYRQGTTHYARFLARISFHPAVLDNRGKLQSMRILLARIDQALSHLSPSKRRHRVAGMVIAMWALMAADEAVAEATGKPLNAGSPQADQVIEMLVGLLTAPELAELAGA